MPLTRCRNFDDSGNELRPGGCPRSDCEYVHPTDPRWPWARKYGRSNTRGRARGRSRSGVGGREDNHATWGHPPPNIPLKTANSIWDSSVARSGDTGKSGWGSVDHDQGTSTSDLAGSQPVSGWGSEGSGWGDPGWGSAGGDNNARGTSEDSGGNKWGDDGRSGWGTTENNGWGGSGKNQERKKDSGWESNEDIGWGTKNTEGVTTSSSMMQGESTRSSASETVEEVVKSIPLPSRKTSNSHISSPMQITESPRIAEKIQTESPGGTAEPLSIRSDSAAREALSRVHVYTSTIKCIQNAVRHQLQLETAQAEVERWKTTQLSSQYSRASPATRKILNDKRADFSHDATEITKRLKHTISALSELPDLSVAPGKAHREVDENQIMEYTAQLKDWIGQLQLDSRIALPSAPENRSLRPQDGQSWTWEHLKESLDELERRADNVAEQIYLKKFTHMMDIMDPDERISALLDAHHDRENSKAALAGEHADVFLQNIDKVGNELSDKVLLAAQLFTQVQRNEEELARLRDEKEQHDATKSRIEDYLEKFEVWKQEDTAQIQQLTDQIKNLHTLHILRCPTPPLLDIEDIRPKIRELVISKLENEVAPVISHFRAECTQNNKDFAAGLCKKLKPILDLTNNICCRAREEIPQVS